MADETKTEETAKTVADIDSRRTFKTVDEALAYIGEIGEFVGFGDLQQAIVGAIADDDGNVTLDPAIYDDSMEIAVAIVSEKVAGAKMKPIALAVIIRNRADDSLLQVAKADIFARSEERRVGKEC